MITRSDATQCPDCKRDVEDWDKCVCGWQRMTDDTPLLPKRTHWPSFLIALAVLAGATAIAVLASNEFGKLQDKAVAEYQRGVESVRPFTIALEEENKALEGRIEAQTDLGVEYKLKAEAAEKLAAYEHKRATFWYKWQHAKNGPHCFRALRLMEQYEIDAQWCTENMPENTVQAECGPLTTPSIHWWCDQRLKIIETNTNKVEMR